MFRLFCILLVGLVVTGCQLNRPPVASNLMPCPTDTALYWTNCFGTVISDDGDKYVGEFKDDKAHGEGAFIYANNDELDKYVGGFKSNKLHGQGTIFFIDGSKYVGEFRDNKGHGQGTYYYSDGTELKAYFGNSSSETPSSQMASSSTSHQSNTPSSTELTAAQKESERLRQELAALKAQQEQEQQTISNDTQIPLITIASADTKGKQGVIRGRASDNVGVAEVTIDGKAVAVQSNGNFEYSTFVPATGLTVTVQATDMAGLSSKQTVSLQRNVNLASASISFDRLNPIGKPALKNKEAIALIIGIGSYENIIDAAYADKDALMFRDYAIEKLGILESRIKTLINEDAEIGEVLLSIRKWIRRSTKPEKTDVFVFYAGHGIATAIGEAYILPFDGRPEVDLLDKTALLQKELFAEIEKAKPRNVTIFLDACYTGKARTGEVLMVDANYRPIAIRPIDDGMPDNFTLITASSGDEFSGPLEEAKHGLFSYFLMKGMEGEADANNDNEITAGELHSYVQTNVIQQSSGSQTPELQGDADRVLVRFQ